MTITPDDILKYCLDNLDGTVENKQLGRAWDFLQSGWGVETWCLCLDGKRKGWRQ